MTTFCPRLIVDSVERMRSSGPARAAGIRPASA
jgi:hypothetical protein